MSADLPKGWVSAKLEDIAETNPRHPAGLNDTLKVTFVRMAAVSELNWKFQYTEESILGQVRKGYTHFAEGDVLFAKITPCMENGKAAVAKGLKNKLGCGSTEFHVVRPRAGIDSKYIYYFVHQEAFRREAAQNFTGTAGQLRVPVQFIKAAELPIPPTHEQCRIVEKLETLLWKVDTCQKRLEKIRVILKRFRQSVLAAACSGRLTADWREDANLEGDLPSGWKPACVGDVIEDLKYGTSQKCSYDKKGVPVLRIPNVVNGIIDHGDLKFATLPKQELKQLRLSSGDILIIRSNGSVSLVGKSAIVREPDKGFAYAGYLIRIRPNRTIIDSEFLNLVLSSYEVRLQIEMEARSTSGVNNINSGEVRSLQLSLPPLKEQHEIVRRVKEFYVLADQIETRYAKAKTYVDKITQSILAKAFRGELVPQDPSDEPATVFLERLRKERSAATTTTKKRNKSALVKE